MFKLCVYWVYDASPSWLLGWDLIFVHWMKKTHLRRFSFHWRKKTHLRWFSTGVYKEGSFNSWRGRIFHSAQSYFLFQVLFIEKPVPRTIDVEVVVCKKVQRIYIYIFGPRYNL